jgi:pyrroloquinoline quinone (PQQ) biosynthesis protein C
MNRDSVKRHATETPNEHDATDLGVAGTEHAVAEEIVGYCHAALERSRFFGALQAGSVSSAALRYIFGQYRLLRDRFQTWFGLCIVKSGSCDDEDVRAAILSLADHIAVEMRDGHDKLFRDFLAELGMSEAEIRAMRAGGATRRYDASFFERYGLSEASFFEAVTAISAREILHSIRNAYVLEHFLSKAGLGDSPWWRLHVDLELDHFKAALRPVIQRSHGHAAAVAWVVQTLKREIDRHVQYWDELLQEAEAGEVHGANGALEAPAFFDPQWIGDEIFGRWQAIRHAKLKNERGRNLAVIAANQRPLWEYLRRRFENEEGVEVILERRHCERRQGPCGMAVEERRRRERRTRRAVDAVHVGWVASATEK